MLMYRAIRVTTDDYRDFRKASSKMVFSIYDKKDVLRAYPMEVAVSRKAFEASIRTRSKFIEAVLEPEREMYFFLKDDEQIGFFELYYHKGKCDIVEFFVFDRYHGHGTEMWNCAVGMIKEHKATRVELWSPYRGAQIFWEKMGFERVTINGVLCYRKKLRYS